jgi:Rrf2 family iron-sulfur cluster assembly transcriptional regulator
MNVSTKSEYGLRALIHLTGASGREAIPVREIAERWNVPVKYLEQILKTLKESGLVVSQMGAIGGYRLARPALVGVLDQTTIADLCTQANQTNLVSLKSSRK